jgi:hypothetical protein
MLFANPLQEQVVDALLDHSALTAKRLKALLEESTGTSVPKSTVYGQLHTLSQLGAVVKYHQEYRLSSSFFRKFNTYQQKVSERLVNSTQYNQQVILDLEAKKEITMQFPSGFAFDHSVSELSYLPASSYPQSETTFTYSYAFLLTEPGQQLLQYAKQSGYRFSILLNGGSPCDRLVRDMLEKDGHQVWQTDLHYLEKPDTEWCVWGGRFILEATYPAGYIEEEKKLLKACGGEPNEAYMRFYREELRTKSIKVTMASDPKRAKKLLHTMQSLMT